ncbi:MAG: hypothetical protein P8J64_00160 [Dehalococcoidia bacterium]|nr:hypothetical protein [Dehalococcoidia bacterium]
MTTEELIISAVRILGALLILRWMLFGSILAVVIDLSDLFLMNLLDMGGVGNYQALDKWLDLTYMATFLWVSLRWEQPYRRIAVLLFAYRIIGVLIFEVIGNRWILLAFPNVFEFWVIAIAFTRHYFSKTILSARSIFILLMVLLVFKEFQEYALHGGKWLDKYTAVGVVKYWWSFLANIHKIL